MPANEYTIMIIHGTLRSGIITLFLIAIFGSVSAVQNDEKFTFEGNVIYSDIEGGFYGIITDSGDKFLPVNLPESYKINNLSVHGVASLDTESVSIQMWGKMITIDSIDPTNGGGISELFWSSTSGGSSDLTSDDAKTRQDLIIGTSALQKKLHLLDEQLKSEAINLSGKNLQSTDLNASFLHLSSISSAALEVSAIDTAGTIKNVAPDNYKSAIGSSISKHPIFENLKNYPTPSMTSYTISDEKNPAVYIVYPVYSGHHDVTGYISVMVNPHLFIQDTLSSIPELTDAQFMVIQPDGRILYDTDSSQNGLSTWNEPFNKSASLIQAAVKLQNARAGVDVYRYPDSGSGSDPEKNILWSTITLHSMPWRVAIMSISSSQ